MCAHFFVFLFGIDNSPVAKSSATLDLIACRFPNIALAVGTRLSKGVGQQYKG
jgi:hypothetical protein